MAFFHVYEFQYSFNDNVRIF